VVASDILALKRGYGATRWQTLFSCRPRYYQASFLFARLFGMAFKI